MKFRKVFLYSLATAVTIGLASYAIVMSDRAEQNHRDLNNSYDRAFYDLTSYMDNVEVLLAESMIIAHPVNTSITLEEIWRQANLAQENISQLPVGQSVLSTTSKFLNQLSTLAYAASNSVSSTGEIPESYRSELENMHQYCLSLATDLHYMEDSISDGTLDWGVLGQTLYHGGTSDLISPLGDHLVDIPEIVYDGQYSDHLTNSVPKGLKGNDITSEDAVEIMKAILEEAGVETPVVTLKGESEGVIPIYSLGIETADGSNANAAITKTGGMLLWYLWGKESTDEINISIAEAQEMGADFLAAIGFEEMVATHTETVYNSDTGNIITVNYCYEKDGVRYYPDLVKVRIDGTDGTVVGVEARGYINCHSYRDSIEAAISEEDALTYISSDVTVDSISRAVIPTDYGTEKDVYEITVNYMDKTFLVYIDVMTGREERILVKTPE
ncbi:MAG: germination protein YpeB [Clostridia bacterium]|nr:germination protein YpeB [Clostridia bacterium]